MPAPITEFKNYAAFNCPLHRGILILPREGGDEDERYCTECGHLLQEVGPLHDQTVEALVAGATAARTLGVTR